MRRQTLSIALSALTLLTPGPVSAQADPTYPNYRIRYLADVIDRDEDGERLVEEGVFNTTSQANEVINLLAHLVIAHQVDCSCEGVRRDVIGAAELEEELMGMLSGYGYVSRLVPSAEVGGLPAFVGVLTPYLTLNGDGFRESNQQSWGGSPWNGWWGSGGTSTLDPSNPRQYARVDNMGIFVDTRLSGYVRSRISQILSGYQIGTPSSLCAFAALDHAPDDMISWVLIRDLRATWPGGEAQ